MATESSPLTGKSYRTTPVEESVVRFIRRLEQLAGRPLEVRFHRNRRTYFSCRMLDGIHRVRVRLHESFLDAPPDVVQAVATLVCRQDARSRRVIRSFVDAQSLLWDKLADRPRRVPKINPRGNVHDLQALFDELNERYFDRQCLAKITWGNDARRPRRRYHITFGTCDKAANVIRIHPALDHPRVPEFFVRYIAFHEMLHAALPVSQSPGGKRLYHSRLFRQRERMFEDFARARRWGKQFLEEVTRIA